MKNLILFAALLCQALSVQAEVLYRLKGDDVALSSFWNTNNLTTLVTQLNASSLTINPGRLGVPSMTGQDGKVLTNDGTSFLWGSAAAGTLSGTTLSSSIVSASITSLTALTGNGFVTTTGGTGALSVTGISAGGNGAADVGKATLYGSSGAITSTAGMYVYPLGGGAARASLLIDSIVFYDASSHTLTLNYASLTANRAVTFQDKTGTVALLSDITLDQIPQAGATNGQGIVWNGSHWVPGSVGGALIVGTSAVTSSNAGKLLTTAGGVLTEADVTYTTNSVQIGVDVADADAPTQVVVAASATGTDRQGGDILVKSGSSSGAGTAAVRFATPAPGSSGTTPNTQVERLRIDSTGLWIENTSTPQAAPPEGSFIIYVDPGTGSLRAMGANGTITNIARP